MVYANSKILTCTSVGILALAIFIIYVTNNNKYTLVGNSKEDFNITQLVKGFGYPIDVYEIITEDGYILTLHRIPPKNHEQKNHQMKPVLFVHGYLNSAIEFVIAGPEKALSLILADRGFDIWFLNARGTSWSRKHVKLNPDEDKEFWNFSFHEIGYYDVPSAIDRILHETGQKKLHYVGFSQGSQAFGVMGSERPEYAEKIKLATLLAPACFISEPLSPIIYITVYFRNLLENLHNLLGHVEIFSSSGLIAKYMKYICNEESILMNVCAHHIFTIQGFDEEQKDTYLLSQLFMNVPAGSSLKQLVHIIQLFDTGKSQKYDYGPEINIQKYGSDKPSQYDYGKIKTPVAIYYGQNDWTVNIKNMKKIEATFPNIVKSYRVPFEKFNHNDFLIAKDVVRLVYDSVIDEILKY